MKNKSLFFCLDVFKAYVNFEMSNADVPGNNGDIRNMMKRILKEYDPRLRPNYLGKVNSLKLNNFRVIWLKI